MDQRLRDLLSHGPAKIQAVCDALGVNPTAARALLRAERAAGRIVMRGNTRGAIYALADAAPGSEVEIKLG